MAKNNPPSQQRLEAGEHELLKTKAQRSSAWHLRPVIVIAFKTAARLSEILDLEWSHIDLENKQPYSI